MDTRKISTCLCTGLLAFLLTACDNGPAEEAGEKLDNTIEENRAEIEAIRKEVEEAREELKQLQQERLEAQRKLEEAKQERQKVLEQIDSISRDSSTSGQGNEQQPQSERP